VRDPDYSFGFHRDFLLRLVERLDLRRLTLVVQDWGVLIGLTLPIDAGFRDRLSRLIAMNTILATGVAAGAGFAAWRQYVRTHPDLQVGALIARGTPHLTEHEIAAYDAPFPDATFKAGVQAFPQLVMTSPEMEGVDLSLEAKRFWAEDWGGSSFLAWGAADPGCQIASKRDPCFAPLEPRFSAIEGRLRAAFLLSASGSSHLLFGFLPSPGELETPDERIAVGGADPQRGWGGIGGSVDVVGDHADVPVRVPVDAGRNVVEPAAGGQAVLKVEGAVACRDFEDAVAAARDALRVVDLHAREHRELGPVIGGDPVRASVAVDDPRAFHIAGLEEALAPVDHRRGRGDAADVHEGILALDAVGLELVDGFEVEASRFRRVPERPGADQGAREQLVFACSAS